MVAATVAATLVDSAAGPDSDVLTSSSNSSMDWLASFPVPQMTLTLYIPTTSVGAVIGRRGSTIATIQKQAQTPNAPPVRVSIVGHAAAEFNAASPQKQPDAMPMLRHQSPTTDVYDPATTTTTSTTTSSVPFTYTPLDFTDPAWTPVVIRADPLAAWTVANRVQALCPVLQDSIVDLPIGRQRHAAIVGKRGWNLMQTSASTQCRIWVPPKELKLDLLQLEGQLSNIAACLKALQDILSSSTLQQTEASTTPSSVAATTTTTSPAKINNPNNKSKANQQQQQNHQAQLIVPQLPSQTKLRSVGRKTDTLIKKKKQDESWILTICGSTEAQVQSAVGILSRWAEQLGSGSGGETAEATSPALPTPTPPSTGAAASNNNRNMSTSSPATSPRSGGKTGGGGRGGGNRGGSNSNGGRGGRGRKGRGRGGRGAAAGNNNAANHQQQSANE